MTVNPITKPFSITITAAREVRHMLRIDGDLDADDQAAREIITTELHKARAEEPFRHHWTFIAAAVLLTAYTRPDGEKIVVQINQNHYHRLTK